MIFSAATSGSTSLNAMFETTASRGTFIISVASKMLERINPGQTTLTFTPRSCASARKDIDKPTTADLVAE